MKRSVLISSVMLLFLVSCVGDRESDSIIFQSDFFKISINENGFLTQLIDRESGKNYLSPDSSAALMSVRVSGKILLPTSAVLKKDTLIFDFENDIRAKIKVEERKSHVNFQLLSLTKNSSVDLIIWGPYPTTLNKIIGETVGVVQGEEFALGIQALNAKTLGGYPCNENDCMPQIDIFDQSDFSDISEKGKRYVLYRVEAAKPTDFGSTLQAYCRNRFSDRIIENWGKKKYVVPAFDDGGVIGSKIALFGCPVNRILQIIEKIELAEDLPHPMIQGKWGKTSPLASSAYLILDFGENDIEKAIAITKKAGLKYLYHSGPFKTWGHFLLKENQFPQGIESMKRCVEIAKRNGITVGVHTLSNFITTNDPYVTPIPDKRLAKVGSSLISNDIDVRQTEIPIESPEFFAQYENNNLKTVMLEDELIRYNAVSEKPPWKLLNCQRGAFGTKASAHKKGSVISLLADHGYKVFLTNAELSMEVAKNIADFFNRTGVRQISFDGLEGNQSTGMGNYGEILFTKTWYDNLNQDIKNNYIADASRTSHFFWHIYSRMNWGEPWYAGFRESQTQYRLKNQAYFRRNLMPNMLGWFLMRPETSIEDIEWLLARSAAFNAGYAFVTSYKTIAENGESDQILQLLGEWEKVRINGGFTEDQRQRMKDIKNEFTLKKVNEKEWELYQVFSNKFKHDLGLRQPGEPLFSTFTFRHKGKKQTMHFILLAVDCDVSQISMEIDNYKKIILPISLRNGQKIKYTGGNKARVYDNTWHLIGEIPIDSIVFSVSEGEHTIQFDCQFHNSSKSPAVKVEIRTFGEAEKIVLKK